MSAPDLMGLFADPGERLAREQAAGELAECARRLEQAAADFAERLERLAAVLERRAWHVHPFVGPVAGPNAGADTCLACLRPAADPLHDLGRIELAGGEPGEHYGKTRSHPHAGAGPDSRPPNPRSAGNTGASDL